MTKTLLTLALMCSMSACVETPDMGDIIKANNDSAVVWINKNNHPITAVRSKENSLYNSCYTYTLIDNGGKIYNTGWCNLQLPKTIK